MLYSWTVSCNLCCLFVSVTTLTQYLTKEWLLTDNHYKSHHYSLFHTRHLSTNLLYALEKTFLFLLKNCVDFISISLLFHQLCLISTLCLHPSLCPTPPVCVRGRLCVRLCAEGRVQVRRGFRRWAWRTPTSWRWMLSSSWATPSWAGTAARWASDPQTALCWPVRPRSIWGFLTLARMWSRNGVNQIRWCSS